MQENVSALAVLKEETEEQKEAEDTEEETLPSALLQEKNQEIDHLNNEIQRLEQELENTTDSKVRLSRHRIHAVSVEVLIVDQAFNFFLIVCFDLFLTKGFGG